jgi:sigma-B regulation protein RsbU (phosphoserine phosphatase)
MLDLGIPFLGEKIVLNPGDKLFLYTDGIPEAMNEEEEEYSRKNDKFLKSHAEKNRRGIY